MRFAYYFEHMLPLKGSIGQCLREASSFQLIQSKVNYSITSALDSFGKKLTTPQGQKDKFYTYPLSFRAPDHQLPPVLGNPVSAAQGPTSFARVAPMILSVPHTHGYTDILEQQQAIYDELLASPEWVALSKRPVEQLNPESISAHELARDLACWAPPQAGALRSYKQ